jgi:zinc protease
VQALGFADVLALDALVDHAELVEDVQRRAVAGEHLGVHAGEREIREPEVERGARGLGREPMAPRPGREPVPELGAAIAGVAAQAHRAEQVLGLAGGGDGVGHTAAERPPADAVEDPVARERDRVRRRDLDQVLRDPRIARAGGHRGGVAGAQLAKHQACRGEGRRGSFHVCSARIYQKMPGPVPRAYHFAAAALVALAAAFGAVRPAPASSAVHEVHTHRFENGLTLHVAPGHPAPVAAIQAWVGVGSADEAADQAGMAHAVEHMLFKGSAGYGLGELVRGIERGGGEINAWTAFDHTVYHAVLGRDHVDAAIHALGDALIEPRVDPDDLAREREVILEEIRQGSDDPARSVAQSLFATAFVAHPYRRPVIGSADSVARIGERALVGFFRDFYVADNLTLVVAGDVDPERVVRSVGRRFRAMPSGRPARRATTEPAQTEPRASCAHRDVAEAYLAVGFHVPALRHPDVAALDVAAILLGQSESARLVRELRDRDELVTSAYANLHALRDPGLLVLSATARPADAAKGLSALVERSALLVDELTAAELDKARIAVEAAHVRQLETAQGRARSLGWHATLAGDPQFGHVYLDRVRAVRRHDVGRVLHRYLQPANASVAAILPAGKKASAPRAWAKQAETRVRKALAKPAPAASAAVDKRVVLASGVTVIVRRDPSVPIVAMRAVWRGGQRVEDASHAGASTLLARMLTRGCAARDAAGVADQIDRLGGALTGVAGRNSFGVAAEWLASSWQPGLALLADCVLEPSWPAAELTRERKLVQGDQAAQRTSPSQVAFRLFSETLYGAHPYGRDVLGTADSIANLSRPELAAFYRDRYPVSAMTIAIVGDVDVDEVIAAVRARFDRVAKVTPAGLAAVAPLKLDGRSASEREVFRFLDRAQAHLVIGFPGATVDAADRFALEVLIAILGGQSGRLFTELRDHQALVYRVSAHSVEGLDPGFVAIYLSCAPDKLTAAVTAVKDELAKLRDHGVTAAEIERAQSYLIGSHQIAMQRRAAVANAIAYHEAYGLGWQSWLDYDAQIRAVTPAQIAAAAASYLRDDRAITATVRPPIATPAATRRSKLPLPPEPLPPAKHPPPRPRGNV